jgi:hypothetical protein
VSPHGPGNIEHDEFEKTLGIRLTSTVAKKMTSKNIKKCQKTSKILLLFEAAAAGLGMILGPWTEPTA